MSIFKDTEEARSFLEAAGVFYMTRGQLAWWQEKYPEGHKRHDSYDESCTTELNMNDTFGWAFAMGVPVPEDKMIEVATLFWRYGNCGLEYWAAEQENIERSEFEDVTRGIEFVRHEEKLRKEIPDSSERAYKKYSYTLGKG